MADPFVGEIRIFPFNFAPLGWALCNGQILPISQYAALFSLLGVAYGGDGRTTFGLPNLPGRAPVSVGQGPGLSLYALGEVGGETAVTVLATQMPAHTHSVQAKETPPAAGDGAPGSSVFLARSTDGLAYANAADPGLMSPSAISIAGGSEPHNNLMPYLTFNFCIALQGVFPTRP
jgi:microcystin-dependent protein